MRRMPMQVSDEWAGVRGGIPAIHPDYWFRLVATMIGRETTANEQSRIQCMARHNWTARVAAEDIIGRDLTSDEVEVALRRARTDTMPHRWLI